MDFLEGFLMGPHWSDTDYETRRHIGFYLLVGLAAFSGFVGLLVYPDIARQWIWPWPVPALLLLLLMLLNPYICRHYYRHNRIVRILALLVLTGKHLLVILLLYAIVLPQVNLDLTQITQTLLVLTNESIARMTDRFSAMNNGAAMILGILLGSLLVLLRALLLLLAAVLIPCLALLVVRGLQFGLDYLIRRQIFREKDTDQ